MNVLICKPLLAILTALAILAPSVAEAGKYSSKSKVTSCSSYQYITGTVKSVCRTR